MIVRRLTPGECEALQDWDPDHTKYAIVNKVHRKGPLKGQTYEEVVVQADGPRYKQCGNGVTSAVSYWLAYRYFREVEQSVQQSLPQAA